MEGYHTYYAGEASLLVHNMCDLGKTVKEILKNRKGKIKNAPLPIGSPSWEEILSHTMEEIEEGARLGKQGYKTIKKLLKDKRFVK